MAPASGHPMWKDGGAKWAVARMAERRTVPVTVGSFIVGLLFSGLKRRQVRRRMAACPLDPPAVLPYPYHYAAGKFQSSMGDVHFIAEHRYADSFDFDDRLADQREKNIQIVNH